VDKRVWIGAGVATLAIFLIFLFNLSSSLKRDLRNLKAQQTELLLLRDEFLSLKNRVEAVERKKSLTKVEGVVQAVDQVFQPLGLKQKVKSVKPTGRREMKDVVEEEAEVQIEKVDMNEMVNIIYKMENAPMILTIKKTTIKTSFENPSHLTLIMTITLIKGK
jgi:hypothetical protein